MQTINVHHVKKVNTKITELLHRYSGRLRITFRNHPLSFHKLAIPAAITAEAARQQGKFWPVHDALYTHQSSLSTRQFDVIVKDLKLNRERMLKASKGVATQAIQEDQELVNKLRINWTPAFILCCPDNHVFLLVSLDQVDQYIPTASAHHPKSISR